MISEADLGGFARTIIETEIKIEINAKSSFRQAGFSRELNNPASFPYRSRNISGELLRARIRARFLWKQRECNIRD